MANGTTGPGSPPIAADAYDHTGNVFLDVLVGWGWLDVGGDRNITYYFDETSAYHLWTNFEKGMWRAALQEWANVANITTQELSSAAGADLFETWVPAQTLTNQFGLDPNGLPWIAAHYLPHQEGNSAGEYNRIPSQALLTPGAFGYWIFVHEIGHGLGLSHPHGMVQLQDEPFYPGVNVPADLGDFGYNQMVYSLMSYNRGQYVYRFDDYGMPATPMAFDIAAIQFLYGPNTTYHSGSDTYLLPDDNAAGAAWQCIWDAGGNDRIGYNGTKNVTIDLRPATLVFGDPIAGGAISKADGIFGGYTIAKGVIIEEAVGGNGNDTLVGNTADNVLNGRAGDDTAVFSGNRASYTVQNLGDRVVVIGPDGTDTLFSIEHAKFANATLDLNAATMSDALWSPTGVRDLTGDGTSDVVWYNVATRNVDLWKIANGQWAGSVSLGTHPPGWQPAGSGDLNGDGTSDVLWYNPSTGNADLWKIANGQWAGSVSIGSHPLGWQLAGVGDLNGDGTGDLVWFNPSTGNVDLWKISNGQWAGSVSIGAHPLGYQVAGTGDFDHDGTADVLWYSPTNGTTEIWKIVNGQWSATLNLGSHPLGWVPAGIGDFNHDGTSDIAWYNSTTRDIDIWQIVSGKWNASFDVGSHPSGWAPAGVGESNNDGFSDIAWYNSATGNIDIWQIVNAHWAASVNVGTHPLN
ncbi:MAG: FG-GAP-like repeat-containing protein [Xanthobacteraceae bacterium]